MNRPMDRIRTHPITMVVLVVVTLLVIIYGTISVSAKDLRWFQTEFESRPDLIILYHHEGKRTTLRPGQPGFDDLAGAVQYSLAQGVVRPSGIGFSEDSLLDATTRFVSVEVFFDEPVKLHAWFNTGRPTQLLFPITGRHSELNLVLLGQNGKYLSSPPALKTIEPIRAALTALGYYDD